MWIIVPELWPEICFPAWRHRTGLTWGKEMEALREGRRSGSQKHLTPRNWVLEKQGQVPPILSSPSKGVTESLPRLSACVWGTRILRPRQVKWLPDFQPTTFSTTKFNITKYVLVYLVYPLVQSLFIFSVITVIGNFLGYKHPMTDSLIGMGILSVITLLGVWMERYHPLRSGPFKSMFKNWDVYIHTYNSRF